MNKLPKDLLIKLFTTISNLSIEEIEKKIEELKKELLFKKIKRGLTSLTEIYELKNIDKLEKIEYIDEEEIIKLYFGNKIYIYPNLEKNYPFSEDLLDDIFSSYQDPEYEFNYEAWIREDLKYEKCKKCKKYFQMSINGNYFWYPHPSKYNHRNTPYIKYCHICKDKLCHEHCEHFNI
jgi:ribosomal protein L29